MKLQRYLAIVTATVLLAGCGGSQKTTVADKRYVRQPIKETTDEILKTEGRLIDAVALQESGRSNEAMEAYAALAADEPQCAAAWYELGRQTLMRGWTDSAVACLRRAVDIDGSNSWYLMALAEAQQRQGDARGRVATLERLVAAKPTVLEHYYELSNANIEAGDLPAAVEALERVERMTGVTEPISLQKQRLWAAAGKPDKALREVERLAEAMPQEKRYQAIVAEGYMSQGKYIKAKQYYDRILATDPDDEYIHIQLAEYYKRIGKAAEADREMEAAFANGKLDCRTKMQLLASFYDNDEFYDPRRGIGFRLLDMAKADCGDEPEFALVYGDALMRQQRYPEAAMQIEKALQRDSSRYEVWEGLIICLANDTNREEDLERYSARAERLFPMKTLPCYMQALCAMRRDDYRTAVDKLERTAKWGYQKGYLEAECTGLMAESYYRTGQYAKAWKAFDRYMALQPKDWGMMNNYAYYLAEQNINLDKALELSRRTIEAEPDNDNSLDTYGWILHLLGRDAEALPYLRKAVSLDPKSDTLKEHLKEVEGKLKDKE